MGLSYSYEIIADRDSADRLLHSLCAHVQPDDRSRLLAALGSGVAEVMIHVKRTLHELPRGPRRHVPLCLSFLFSADGPLTEYSEGESRPLADGRIPIGCVWTSI